jgi:hypothetical protein
MMRTEHCQVQSRVSEKAPNTNRDAILYSDCFNCTHVQDLSINEASYSDEVSPIGPAPPTNTKNSTNCVLPGNNIDVQRQLVELIHVLRRIALARRVALESTAAAKAVHGAKRGLSVDRAGCSTQQVIDLLLLAKSMAAQAMKISIAKPSSQDGEYTNNNSKNLYISDRSNPFIRNSSLSVQQLIFFSLIESAKCMTKIDRTRDQMPGGTGASSATASFNLPISVVPALPWVSMLTCTCESCKQAKRLPEILSLVIGNMQTSRLDGKLDQELKGILRELERMALSNPTPDLKMSMRSGVWTKDRPARDDGPNSAAVSTLPQSYA